tara:strand:- start:41709 stop:42059 length:351 start_codon:yes stop_codon:yes gene_type:complete
MRKIMKFEEKHINFYKKFILQTKTFNDGRVVLSSYSANYLTLNIIFQRNDLVYLRPYSERQVKLHRIIQKLKEKRHMNLKSIADKLNALGIKTYRGNTFLSGSILKRKREMDRGGS